MNTRRSPRDWQLLSEYLDGLLPAKDKNQLENRLRSDSALHADLDRLKNTKTLLRSAPRRRVPHNFTLSPQVAQQAKKQNTTLRSLFPIYSLASVTASFLFLILLLFEALPVFSPMVQSAAMIEEIVQDSVAMEKEVVVEEPAMMAAPAEEMSEDFIEQEAYGETAAENDVDENIEELSECDACEPLHEMEKTVVEPELAAADEVPEQAPAPLVEQQADEGTDPQSAERELASEPTMTPLPALTQISTVESENAQVGAAPEVPRGIEEEEPSQGETIPEPGQWQTQTTSGAPVLDAESPTTKTERGLPTGVLRRIILLISAIVALISGFAARNVWRRMRS
jgi:hypothetical protein